MKRGDLEKPARRENVDEFLKDLYLYCTGDIITDREFGILKRAYRKIKQCIRDAKTEEEILPKLKRYNTDVFYSVLHYLKMKKELGGLFKGKK
jgi:hypothetical protein